MSFSKKLIRFILIPLVGIEMLPGLLAAQGVILYTPYSKITVPPGEKINYNISVINKSEKLKNVGLLLSDIKDGWTYQLKSGGWNISQLSILPGDKKSVSLTLNVPFKVQKGTYRFNVVARGLYTLPLTVIVSRKGTYKTEFTTNQSNMEGHAKSSFTFTTTLKNITGEKQRYALKSFTPRGWAVIFKPKYKQATSVEIEPNNSEKITIEVHPPNSVEAGTYKIPVQAVTNTTSAELKLEVVITGSYRMELTTPSGLLSTDITAGDQERVKLLIENSGSARFKDINLSSSAPAKWEVTFSPEKIPVLDPGKSSQVLAIIKADKKAIAGDYVTKITARTPEVSSTAAFRITVETPLLMGWIGILVILIALGSVWYLFRKFGRR